MGSIRRECSYGELGATTDRGMIQLRKRELKWKQGNKE
jgi:hypothetical protein